MRNSVILLLVNIVLALIFFSLVIIYTNKECPKTLEISNISNVYTLSLKSNITLPNGTSVVRWQNYPSSIYNQSTGIITIPQKGAWNISFSFYLTRSTEEYVFTLYYGERKEEYHVPPSVYAGRAFFSGSINVNLNSGQQVYFTIHTLGANLLSSGSLMSLTLLNF